MDRHEESHKQQQEHENRRLVVLIVRVRAQLTQRRRVNVIEDAVNSSVSDVILLVL